MQAKVVAETNNIDQLVRSKRKSNIFPYSSRLHKHTVVKLTRCKYVREKNQREIPHTTKTKKINEIEHIVLTRSGRVETLVPQDRSAQTTGESR